MYQTSGPEFVTLQEFADYLRIVLDEDNDTQVAQLNATLAKSVAAVATHLRTPSLTERQVTRDIYLRVASHMVTLPDGPCPEVNSVVMDGDAVTDYQIHPWSLEKWDGWEAGVKIELDFMAGYRINSDGSTNMPEPIRQAILVAAGDHWKTPNTRLTGERIGDYAWTGKTSGGEGELTLSDTVKLMLEQWTLKTL
jgi:hypothetical protein